MAKKEVKETKKVIGVLELSAHYEMEPRKLRMLLRKIGEAAPKLEGVEGFGPRSKYSWTEGSKELTTLMKKLDEAVAERKDLDSKLDAHVEKQAAKQKKAPKQPIDEPDEDEDEEYEDEEEEVEDDEDSEDKED